MRSHQNHCRENIAVFIQVNIFQRLSRLFYRGSALRQQNNANNIHAGWSLIENFSYVKFQLPDLTSLTSFLLYDSTQLNSCPLPQMRHKKNHRRKS